MNRKTKIVATINPKELEYQLLSDMANAGVDIFRLNFSYGSYEEYEKIIKDIKELRKERVKPLAILQDLSGSGVRIGNFEYSEGVDLVNGQNFILATNPDILGNKEMVSINRFDVPAKLEEGDELILADGEIKLSVSVVKEDEVHCKVLNDGHLKGNRSLAVVGKDISVPGLTEKDKEDLKFSLDQGVDFVALSFVRSAEDVDVLRSFINENFKEEKPNIIAKIETLKAVENFDGILEKSDGIMVARGDLAIEVEPEEVPILQKRIIKKSNLKGKPVIIATQMLESMVNSPVPTRAETSDVANAILDGTDAVMLSAETAIGKYPLYAIEALVKTSLKVEENYLRTDNIEYNHQKKAQQVDAITSATVKVSSDLGSNLIVALTKSGFTARMISRHRSNNLILALTDREQTFRSLSLSFGCLPLYVSKPESLNEAFDLVRKYVKENDLAEEGDRVIVAAGVPFNEPDAKINMLFIEKI